MVAKLKYHIWCKLVQSGTRMKQAKEKVSIRAA